MYPGVYFLLVNCWLCCLTRVLSLSFSVMQDKFSEALTESGVLLCLSPQWIKCLYDLILCNDILGMAGYHSEERHAASPTHNSSADGKGEGQRGDVAEQPTLVELLIQSYTFLVRWAQPIADNLERAEDTTVDLMLGDETTSTEGGGEADDALLDNSKAPLLQFNEVQAPLSSLVETGVRVFVCKELLQTAWPSVLVTLQIPLHIHPAGNTLKLPNGGSAHAAAQSSAGSSASSSDKSIADASLMVSCLNGLRLVARLCCHLSMQRRCGEVLAILSEAAVDKQQSQTSEAAQQSKRPAAKRANSPATQPPVPEEGLKKRPSVLSALRSVRKSSSGSTSASTAGGTSEKAAPAGEGHSSMSILPGFSTSSEKVHTIPTIQLSHALCLEALFKFGLQSAVDSPGCWEHILK